MEKKIKVIANRSEKIQLISVAWTCPNCGLANSDRFIKLPAEDRCFLCEIKVEIHSE